ncbi:MAG: cupin domain-containing protein [Oscillospiraceae bacterium]|nr:cupin domain-containing protein [Oscillospiraceae bacterium]
MALFIKKEDIPTGEFDMGSTSFVTSLVHGSEASLMYSSRPAGYHSKPHYHESEQISIALSGELYFYTDTQAYKMKEGDALRVPPYVVHWAHNKGDVPFVQVTVHAPSFHKSTPGAVALFDEGEEIVYRSEPENLYDLKAPLDIEKIESMRAIGEDD